MVQGKSVCLCSYYLQFLSAFPKLTLWLKCRDRKQIIFVLFSVQPIILGYFLYRHSSACCFLLWFKSILLLLLYEHLMLNGKDPSEVCGPEGLREDRRSSSGQCPGGTPRGFSWCPPSSCSSTLPPSELFPWPYLQKG